MPTRELAVQVFEVVRQMSKGEKLINSALLIGGDPIQKQFMQLKRNPNIIIGTPGRINDHIKRGLNLSKMNFLVLDETDRMLDMGFGVQLETIIPKLSKERQTLMFSATLPAEIERLSSKYLNNPVRVAMGSTNAPALNIKQETRRISDAAKYDELTKELDIREGSVVVFVKTKRSADKIASMLSRSDHRADALHGDLKQSRRDRVIKGFRQEKYRVLVATDIAARGLDIPHIRHVINYDLPQCAEDYIHRIGRTARAGAEGSSLCFISPADGSKWRAIERLLNPGKAGSSEKGVAGFRLKAKNKFGAKEGAWKGAKFKKKSFKKDGQKTEHSWGASKPSYFSQKKQTGNLRKRPKLGV